MMLESGGSAEGCEDGHPSFGVSFTPRSSSPFFTNIPLVLPLVIPLLSRLASCSSSPPSPPPPSPLAAAAGAGRGRGGAY
eukprot:8548211-Pyramimonas_sp.AAC.1